MRVIFVCLVLCVSSEALLAQSEYFVEARDKTVRAASHPNSLNMQDVIKRVPLEYPYFDRTRYHQGKGLYRVTVDRKTGLVAAVAVIKSTGWATLDAAAVSALRQWRFKSGKLKQFDLPVTYKMYRSRDDAMEHIRRLQAAEHR